MDAIQDTVRPAGRVIAAIALAVSLGACQSPRQGFDDWYLRQLTLEERAAATLVDLRVPKDADLDDLAVIVNDVVLDLRYWRTRSDYMTRFSIAGPVSGEIRLGEQVFEFEAEVPPPDSYNPGRWHVELYQNDETGELEVYTGNFTRLRTGRI